MFLTRGMTLSIAVVPRENERSMTEKRTATMISLIIFCSIHVKALEPVISNGNNSIQTIQQCYCFNTINQTLVCSSYKVSIEIN